MLNRGLKYLIAFSCAILITGCASGPSYKQAAESFPTLSPNQGRIYIYRPSSVGFAVQPDVKVNGTTVGNSTPNGFFFIDRDPGDYEISTTTELKKSLTLRLDPGQTRYVRLNISLGLLVGHVYPELVDNDKGSEELQEETKYSPAKK